MSQGRYERPNEHEGFPIPDLERTFESQSSKFLGILDKSLYLIPDKIVYCILPNFEVNIFPDFTY